MSEQATLIRPVPPIKETDPIELEDTIIPKNDYTFSEILPENSEESGSGKNTVASEVSAVVSEQSGTSNESNDSITVFQGVNYASFILTFCLAGFTAIVVFRKALKVSVKRFSIGAKTLSFAYLVIAFNSFFGAYLYSKFLNGSDTSVPLTIPIISWILVGPAIAVVLNSLLTREDVPSVNKVLFDAFTYLVIFGCVVASQIPSLGAKEPLVFSFFGAFFFIVPIIRFTTSLKIAKSCHPELQEMFVQILVRSLLILPVLLPSLVFVNVYELISDGLTMLLFNLVTFVFVLMSGLLMVISIDYITQGISAEELVTKKIAAPTAKPDRNLVIPPAQSGTLAASAKQNDTALTDVPEPAPAPKQQGAVENKPSAAPPSASKQPAAYSASFEESSEALDFDVEQDDSTVIEFNPSQSSDDKSQVDVLGDSKRKKLKVRSLDPKSSSSKSKNPPQLPKAPPSPDESKPSDSKPSIKPPEKPKKLF